MRISRKIATGILIVGLITLPVINSLSASAYSPPTNAEIAHLLGWVTTPTSPCLPCGGYFYEPNIIKEHPNPAPYASEPAKISAKGPTVFSKTGESILQKDVRISQKGRLSTADKAILYRDKKTGKLTHIHLIGHVRLQEHDKLIVGHEAQLNLINNTAVVDHVTYRLTSTTGRMGKNNGWGTAKNGKHLANEVIELNHGTYSTCSPLHPTWELRAKHITLDKNKQKGKAKSATLRLWNVPVFYTPYISFSMDRTRKSGFLSPIIENASRNGFTFGLPYYWNMAPNYDVVISPIYYTKRHFQISSRFRYITERSNGSIYASYLPNDKEFERFKNDTINQFPSPINPLFQPYITALQREHDYRGYFAMNSKTKLSDKWTVNSEFNYVTDPYYLRDLGATINDIVANQLLNQVDVNYQGSHWNFTVLAQAYQTLHLIEDFNNPTVNQYMRLPELDTSADYPNFIKGFDFDLNMQAVNFGYQSAFPPETNMLPIGQRFHLRPTISRPINWASGYITPAISLDSTSYNVTRPLPLQEHTSSRELPIIDIDSGLYFDRHFDLHQHEYIQTLEPRLFYLYVPYENQNRFPVFDTQVLPFTYEQLFALNRFTGFDRLQNANQTSFGLTSRILDGNNAREILKSSIGIGYYIERPKVCLSPGCMQENERWTPIASSLTYYPTKAWSIIGTFSWDPELSQTNNSEIDIAYTRDGRHIIGAGYTFVHAQPSTPDFSTTGFTNDSALYKAFFAWPLSTHWSTVGYLFYNATEHHPENYFAGLQYDTCCISLRILVNRTFQGEQPIASGTATVNRYQTNYMFQIQLKGIGSAGNENPYSMLETSIPGYRDPFKY